MKIILILLSFITVVGCTRSEDGKKPEQLFDLETILDINAYSLLEDSRFHSASIALYNKGESLIKHYGELEIGKGNMPTDSSIYEIASVTKTFTGILAANAVLDGKISLDDDIRKYLDRPYPNLEYNGIPVKIRHLLTHTSNFPNFPIKGENKEAFFEGLEEITMNIEPGTRYSYSNTAPELMAFILQSVYNKPYDNLLTELVLQKEEMNHTKFILSDAERRNLVKGYNDQGETMPNFKRNLWGGTVGLHSTSYDLLKYIKLQLEENDAAVVESHKKLYKMSGNVSIAYHWYIHEENGVISYQHHGGIYGMQNWLLIYPQYDIGISIVSNSSFDDAGDILSATASKLFEEMRAKEVSHNEN